MNASTLLSTFPLTPMQQGMLYQWRLSKLSGINIEQIAIKLPEAINLDTLKQAWQHTIQRFDALRTAFSWNTEMASSQKIFQTAPLEFACHDWQDKSMNQINADFQVFLEKDRERGFDLDQAPLMRVTVLRLAKLKYRMIWTFHHIVLDGRSFPIVLKDLFEFYEASLTGKAITLPPTPSFKPYVDYVNHMDETKAKAYFQALLADVEEQDLPHPHGDPAQSQLLEIDQNELEARVKPVIVKKLEAFASNHGLTFHTLLQAAWGLALSAYTGKTDIVFGTIRACRHLPVEQLTNLAGMLINTLPFRAKLMPDVDLLTWLLELRQQQIDVRPFEATPLHKIQEWVGHPPGAPLIRTMLMFDYNFLGAVLKKLGGKWRQRHLTLYEKTEFHIGLSAYLDENLVLRLEYDSSVYQLDVCEDILGFVVYLLEHFPQFAHYKLRHIPTMPKRLQQDILELMSPKQDFVTNCGLHQLFEEQVRKTPEAIAIRTQDSEVSYRALDQSANQWAHFLAAQGVRPGDIVGLSLHPSPILVHVLLGILKAGAAYLPLDPNYPNERLLWMLEDTDPACVISENALLEKLPLAGLNTIVVEQATQLAKQPKVPLALKLNPEQPAIVIFTSGSTGRPKGVLLPHRALINHNQAVRRMFCIDAKDVVPQMSTINFDVSIEEIYTTLHSGACLVMPTQQARDSISGFLRFIKAEALTILNLTTLLWQEVVHHLVRTGEQFPASVRLIIAGGERTTHSAYNEFLKVGGKRIQWINAYGPTETCPMATAFEFKNLEQLETLHKDPPIGRPIDNTSCYVLDPLGRLLPPGVPGELYIGGSSVSLGYLKNPELTRARFLPDPFQKDPSATMYKSGDRVRLSAEDGQLEYLDRLDNQVKLRGFRIELGEVESALNRFDNIDESIVQPVKMPSGQMQLVAYVLTPQGDQYDTTDLVHYIRDQLPSFMQPGAIIPLRSYPKTPSGKIDRRALPAPNSASKPIQSPNTAPKNQTQATILKHWQEILGVPEIGLQDNFFALGGDSLKAMTLATRIEEAFKRTIPLALLINSPTVAMYAQAIDQDMESAGFAPLIHIKKGKGTPLFLLHSLGGDILIYRQLAEQFGNANPIYGIQMQGLDRQKAPHNSIEACAKDFLSLVKSVQPDGPYAFAGYSSGGLIAFEMARQLEAKGETTVFLGLIDSAIPPQASARNKPSTGRYMANFLRNLPAWAAEVSRWKPRRLLRAINRKVIKVALNRSRPAATTNTPTVEGFRLEDHFEADISFFPAYRIELIRRHFAAISAYSPQVYTGNACIIRTRRQPLFSPQNKSLGWDQLVQGKLHIHMVACSHAEMLEKPHVVKLAKLLAKSWQELTADIHKIPN